MKSLINIYEHARPIKSFFHLADGLVSAEMSVAAAFVTLTKLLKTLDKKILSSTLYEV